MFITHFTDITVFPKNPEYNDIFLYITAFTDFTDITIFIDITDISDACTFTDFNKFTGLLAIMD